MSEQTFSVPRGRNHSIDQGDLRGSPPKRFPYNSTSSEEDEDDGQQHSDDDYDDEYSRDSISEFSHIRLDSEDSQFPSFAGALASTSAPSLGFIAPPSISDPNASSETRGLKREADDPQPVTRKRTFSNAGPQDANSIGSDPNSQSAQAPASGEKRAATKICRVCGDKSYSYNFNVITCESCKAFFRRNANKEKDIRCPFNDNCDINIVSRRFCQRCRLKKCFEQGMRKEWIMSEEARLEKKQRIQDNRERRAAEKAQQEKCEKETVPVSIPNVNMDTTMLPVNNQQVLNGSLSSSIPTTASVLAPLIPTVNPPLPVASAMLPAVASLQQSVPPVVVPSVAVQPENPIALQAQQVLAAAASQPLPIVQSAASCNVEQQITAAQIAASVQPSRNIQYSIEFNKLNDLAANVSIAAAAAATFNNAQVVQLAQAAKIAEAIQHQAQLEQQAQIASQVQQQIAAQVAAQRLQATAEIVAATQPNGILPTNLTPPAPIASFALSQQPLIEASPPVQPILPPVSLPPAPLVASTLQPTPVPEMVTVPKAVLTAIVQENIENRQAQQNTAQTIHPPLKCVCKCQCGRYPNDIVIVDVVHRDLLNEQQPRVVERMDCQQVDADCTLLNDSDKAELNEILQANTFWAIPNEPVNSMGAESATDTVLRRLIRFTSRLNVFRSLSRNDQAALLKNGCASHFTIRSAMSMNDNGGWSPQNAISDTVVQFFNSLREEWRTNESIMLLLGLLAIFDPAAPNVENKGLVAHESAKLKSILKKVFVDDKNLKHTINICRVLYTLCAQNQQRCCAEYDDLLNKLHVLQSLNSSSIVNCSPVNGVVDSLRWSAEIVEPLLSRELFEPHLLNNVGTIDSVAM
ncbi:Nuclear hormone receptor family member nhr-48 [Aphelenchoides besseyi]|nr:Nuclear hormone receptor family member nhr-48 [Aphelenchoides besseyi]